MGLEILIIALVSFMVAHEEPNPYKSIVRLSYSESKIAMGSIIEIDKKRVLLTNKHVCDSNLVSESKGIFTASREDGFNIIIDGSESNIRTYKDLDLCIIKGNFNKMKPLKVGVKDKKTEILTYESDSESPYFTDRKMFKNVQISDLEDVDKFPLDIRANRQVDSKIVKGMSGTPVLNSESEVIGIVWGNNPIDHFMRIYDYEAFNSPNNIKNGFIITGDVFNKRLKQMIKDLDKQ